MNHSIYILINGVWIFTCRLDWDVRRSLKGVRQGEQELFTYRLCNMLRLLLLSYLFESVLRKKTKFFPNILQDLFEVSTLWYNRYLSGGSFHEVETILNFRSGNFNACIILGFFFFFKPDFSKCVTYVGRL